VPKAVPTDDDWWHELINEIARVQHVALGEGQGARFDLAEAVQRWCRPTPPAPEPGPTFQDAIRLAEGCHDYSGGHSGAEWDAWHGAIDTVVAVLKKATDGPWDSQTMAVFGVGSEAQAGELADLDPVSECPHCGYEGEMVPAPQAGEVGA
jgi:hypothetical protein